MLARVRPNAAAAVSCHAPLRAHTRSLIIVIISSFNIEIIISFIISYTFIVPNLTNPTDYYTYYVTLSTSLFSFVEYLFIRYGDNFLELYSIAGHRVCVIIDYTFHGVNCTLYGQI